MALQCNFDSQFGINFPTAYIKITRFNGDKLQVSFDTVTYVGQQAREDSKQPLASKRYAIPYVDGMAISSLYDYLKTLPEFTGAINV